MHPGVARDPGVMSATDVPQAVAGKVNAAGFEAPVILRSDAMSDGFNADDIQRKRQRGEWVSLRPGAYLAAAECRALSHEQRHIRLIEATLPKITAQAVLSHQSAACLFGITLWPKGLRAVRITIPGASSGHRRPSLHSYRAPLDEDEIITVGGYRITSAARTLIDLGRSVPFESAVVAADSALHRGLCSPDDLANAARRAPRRPGMRNAVQMAAFADGRSESAGESRSRVLFRAVGLPRPESQFRVMNESGAQIARADFGWPEFGTVGEFDGAQKYGRLLRPGQTAGEQVFREKLREDEIRRLGWKVVRWTWQELDKPHELARKIADMLNRGRRSS